MPQFSMRHFSGFYFMGKDSSDSVAENPNDLSTFLIIQKAFAISIAKISLADLCTGLFLCQK
ncbi:hypothetical protein OAT72_02135 [Alphaproteobacteria bacterium]|nr:hypothetical protein [Alphaproteobacteria bacterium]